MVGERQVVRFEHLLTEPVRNGIYKPKEFHGRGAKIVNMGELFAHPRLRAVPMKRVELSKSETERFILAEGDLIFARRSLTAEGAGKCSVVLVLDEPTTFESSIIRARPDRLKAESLYLYYFFNSAAGLHSLDTIRRHVAVAGITGSDLSRLEIPVPSLPEQRAIAHILGTLDDKIELNRRVNETLEAMARALFKSWFVDFDPVRAKAEGQDTGLPKPVADLFPDSFEDSELGEIPKGWEVGSVDDEFDLTMGQSPPGETYNEICEGLPFYQGRADFGIRFPTRRVYCTAPTRLASTGDTLISVRAPVGDINMATERCTIGRGVAAARHKTGSRSYSYQFMHSIEEVFARFEGEGTVFGSIGKKDFHAIPCVMPPRDLVLAFERCLSPIDDRIEVNERESRTLAAQRDTLLPKLISGELRVRNADRFDRRSA
ncbi:MAG: restriction endonuclease subunit S [Burkholderiaceae bacterium]|nr:restriction endonuclease subunit S [Burkholderiaceae bacterium]